MIGQIKIELDKATDAEIFELHEAVHKEAFKRGMRLANTNHNQNLKEDKNSEFKPPYKSIEKL